VLANPVTGVVQLFRKALLGHADYLGVAVVVTTAWVVGLVLATLFAYCRYERVACDRL
jgi:ABC-type polysaccharide/polyol phosphate export permease